VALHPARRRFRKLQQLGLSARYSFYLGAHPGKVIALPPCLLPKFLPICSGRYFGTPMDTFESSVEDTSTSFFKFLSLILIVTQLIPIFN